MIPCDVFIHTVGKLDYFTLLWIKYITIIYDMYTFNNYIII